MNLLNRSVLGFKYMEHLLTKGHWAMNHADTRDESVSHNVYIVTHEELGAYMAHIQSRVTEDFPFREATYILLADNGQMVGITMMRMNEEYAAKQSTPGRIITPESHMIAFVGAADKDTGSNADQFKSNVMQSVVLIPRIMRHNETISFVTSSGFGPTDPMANSIVTIIMGMAAMGKALDTDPEMLGGIVGLHETFNQLRKDSASVSA